MSQRYYRLNIKIGQTVKTVIVNSINMIQLVAQCERFGTECKVVKVSYDYNTIKISL